jgi:hypothetical protein
LSHKTQIQPKNKMIRLTRLAALKVVKFSVGVIIFFQTPGNW